MFNSMQTSQPFPNCLYSYFIKEKNPGTELDRMFTDSRILPPDGTHVFRALAYPTPGLSLIS